MTTDDEASAWLEGAEPLNVTVVTAERGTGVDLLLERALSVQPTFVAPAAYRPGREDVVIFDRVVPRVPVDASNERMMQTRPAPESVTAERRDARVSPRE